MVYACDATEATIKDQATTPMAKAAAKAGLTVMDWRPVWQRLQGANGYHL